MLELKRNYEIVKRNLNPTVEIRTRNIKNVKINRTCRRRSRSLRGRHGCLQWAGRWSRVAPHPSILPNRPVYEPNGEKKEILTHIQNRSRLKMIDFVRLLFKLLFFSNRFFTFGNGNAHLVRPTRGISVRLKRYLILLRPATTWIKRKMIIPAYLISDSSMLGSAATGPIDVAAPASGIALRGGNADQSRAYKRPHGYKFVFSNFCNFQLS